MISSFLMDFEFSGRIFSARYGPGLFFLGWVGDGFRVFYPAYPPRSVSGLLWVIGPLLFGTGHVSGVVGWV